MKNNLTVCLVTLLCSITSHSPRAAAVEANTILHNCRNMNHVAWDEYSKSIVGQPVNGTGRLKSIGGKVGKKSILEKAMEFFGIKRTYALSFALGNRQITIRGFEKEDVLNLKEGASYEYSARQITYVDEFTNWNGCVIVKAER